MGRSGGSDRCTNQNGHVTQQLISCNSTSSNSSSISSSSLRHPPDVLQRPPVIIHKGLINLLKHVQALTHLTKDGMLPIQAVKILASRYVKLACICPFCAACTSNNTRQVNALQHVRNTFTDTLLPGPRPGLCKPILGDRTHWQICLSWQDIAVRSDGFHAQKVAAASVYVESLT